MFSKCKLTDGWRKIIDHWLEKLLGLKVAYQAKEKYYAMCKSETLKELHQIANTLFRMPKITS